MVNIYLKSLATLTPGGTVYTLAIRDSNGHSGHDNHSARIPKGAKVSWELDEDSCISEILEIQAMNPKSGLFKEGPYRVSEGKFEAKVKDTPNTEPEKYYITYIAFNKTKVTIDPYIRIIPTEE